MFDRERFCRALAYIHDRYAEELPERLSYDVAFSILNRVRELIAFENGYVSFERTHELLRDAARMEPGLSDELRAYYRKVINAYWEFLKIKTEAEP